MSQKEEESQKADVKLKVEEEEYAMYAFGTTTNEVLFSLENTFSVCIETELQALEQKFGKCIFKKDHNVEKLHKRFMEVYKQNIGDVEQVTHKLFDINNKTLFDNHVQEDMLLDKDKLLELKNDIKSLEDQFKTNKEIIHKLETELEGLKKFCVVDTRMETMMTNITDLSETLQSIPIDSDNFNFFL